MSVLRLGMIVGLAMFLAACHGFVKTHSINHTTNNPNHKSMHSIYQTWQLVQAVGITMPQNPKITLSIKQGKGYAYGGCNHFNLDLTLDVAQYGDDWHGNFAVHTMMGTQKYCANSEQAERVIAQLPTMQMYVLTDKNLTLKSLDGKKSLIFVPKN